MFQVLGYVRSKHKDLNEIVKGGFVVETHSNNDHVTDTLFKKC